MDDVNVASTTPTNTPNAVQGSAKKNVLMGILSYIGILVIVPYLTAKDDPFVKFHIKQGLVLFVIEAIVWALSTFMWTLWPILSLVNLAVFILSIIGIVHAVQEKEEKLPLVGNFASHFNF